jgi:hypothetical protein
MRRVLAEHRRVLPDAFGVHGSSLLEGESNSRAVKEIESREPEGPQGSSGD